MSPPSPVDVDPHLYPNKKQRCHYRVRQKRARDGHTYLMNPRPTCPYCDKSFVSDRGYSQHIARNAECIEAQRRAIKNYFEARRLKEQLAHLDRQHSQPSPTQWGPWTYSTDMPPISTPNLPPVANNGPTPPSSPGGVSSEGSQEARRWADRPYVEPYPNEQAGSPTSAKPVDFDLAAYLGACGPFLDPKLFEAAERLVMSNLTSAERTGFLQSEVYKGQVPWQNDYAMMKDVDSLPTGPKWSSHTFTIVGEKQTYVLHAFKRDIIQVVRQLIGNPKLKDDMRYAPERQWTSIECLKRIYNEMWTGDWWWELQEILERELDESGTIAALIIASDKSRVSPTGTGRYVYPVYVSLGNISKRARRETSNRAFVLLGYLPIESFQDEPASVRPRLRQRALHTALRALLQPLREAWFKGEEMLCADGKVRRVHPTLAAFEGDWPEQCDATNTQCSGCPKCEEEPDHRGDLRETQMRDPNATLATLLLYKDPAVLQLFRLRPGWPFWADLYPTNFHDAITPDLLHQVYIGIYRHMVSWGLKLMGISTLSGRKKALDQRFSAMPEAHGLRRFPNGVTKVQRWTGRESKEMAKIILPLIADKAKNKPLLTAITALLNFCYLAHSASMSSDDLDEMQDCLKLFHQHKHAIAHARLLGARGWKGLAKLHMLSHYFQSTCRHGVPDGYSTKTMEFLHVEYAKAPWRKVMGREDALPYMIRFLRRREAMRIHRTHLDEFFGPQEPQDRAGNALEDALEAVDDDDWVDEDEGLDQSVVDNGLPDTCMKLALKPHRRAVLDDVAEVEYTKVAIPGILRRYLSPMAETEVDRELIRSIATRHLEFDIWHRVHLYHRRLPFAPHEPPRVETIRAQPHAPSSTRRKAIRRRGIFDTALVEDAPDRFGIHREFMTVSECGFSPGSSLISASHRFQAFGLSESASFFGFAVRFNAFALTLSLSLNCSRASTNTSTPHMDYIH